MSEQLPIEILPGSRICAPAVGAPASSTLSATASSTSAARSFDSPVITSSGRLTSVSPAVYEYGARYPSRSTPMTTQGCSSSSPRT